jgi:periplasmic copper chaperone A
MMPYGLVRLRIAALAFALVATVGLTAGGVTALAAEFKAGDISIEAPWSRETPGGAKVAAGYLTIKNGGATPDRLVSATADIAERTEIHEMSMTDGMVKMRQVTDGVPVPAGGSVALAPQGFHLMFLGLKKPLKEGDTFAGTLTFEKAGTIAVTFEVRGIGAAAPDAGTEHHH